MTDTTQNNEKKPSRRKYTLAAAASLLLIFAALVFILATQESNPDPESEAIIRELVSINLYYKTQMEIDPNISIMDLVRKQKLAINPNKLTDEDFLKIEGFSLGEPFPSMGHMNASMELCDIKLLKKFTNLKNFHIGSIRYPSNKIPRWMSLLAKLGIFNLEDRFALDLSPLKKLNKLENMIIYDTTVKNFKILENLTNLRELSLVNTNISDLEPLKELKNLKTLHIIDCKKITDEQVEDLQKALPELKITK
jgi:hypothetical protein